MEYQEEFENELYIGHGFCENGNKEGMWSYFYDTGELKQEIEYRNGIEEGIYRFFSKNGTLIISAYNNDGVLNGEWKEYYENGETKEVGRYVNNAYEPVDFWDQKGTHLLKNGPGKKIEEYGANALTDVYEQYYHDGKFVKEIKIQGYTYLGFSATEEKD